MIKLPKKKYFLLFFGLLIIFIAIAAGIILPRLISLNTVKPYIEANISAIAGGRIHYQKAMLQFRPWPKITFNNGSIDIKNRLSGTIEAMVVTPKLLPLLTGRFEIGNLRAVAPKLRIHLQEKDRNTPLRNALIQTLAGGFSSMVSGIGNAVKKEINIHLKRGNISIVRANGQTFDFRNIHGNLLYTPKHVSLNLFESSGIGNSTALGIDVNPLNLNGKGHLHCHQLSPGELFSLLFPASEITLGESKIDLNCDIISDNFKKFTGTFDCALNALPITRKKENIAFQNGTVNGSFLVEKDRLEIVVSNLSMATPTLNMAGNFLMDRSAPRYRWEIIAEDMDLKSVGKATRVLAPDARPLQAIFNVLKAGTVKKLHLSNEARSATALKTAENLKIKGLLKNSTVYIPKPDLTLTHTEGWVTVSNRLLKGNKLRAQLGNTKGSGSFSMTLKQKNAPFSLDAAVWADLSELPPLLHRLVPKKQFKKEMTRISNAKGTAEGRLVMDKTPAGLTLAVAVSKFNLSCDYSLIPYPVSIRNGTFHLGSDGIRINNLAGRIGASRFSDLRADIGLIPPYSLNIHGGACRAALTEIHDWLMQYDRVAAELKAFKQVTGTTTIESFTLNGPAIVPSAWQFNLTGRVETLRLLTPGLPSAVLIQDGLFHANAETVNFNNTLIKIMDSQVQAEGKLTGHLTDDCHIETTLSGAMGPDTANWVKKKMGLPRYLAWPTPRFLKPMKLIWNQNSGVSLSGNITVPNGPALALKLKKTPECLIIDQLIIRDDDSDVLLSILQTNKILHFTFTGQLLDTTANKLFAGTPFLSGRIEGDFRSEINLSRPQLSTAKGHLFVEQLDLSKLNVPMTIDRVSFSGTENQLHLSGAHLVWRNEDLRLDGDVGHYRDGLKLNMTAAFEKIDWPRLTTMLKEKKNETTKKKPLFGLPFPVYGQLKGHVDQFICSKKIAFQPLDAQLSFSGDQTDISVSHASLCGISLFGSVAKSPNGYELEATPGAKNQDLAATLACLLGNKKNFDGRYNLDGYLTATGDNDTPLIRAMGGKVSFSAEKGRIHRFGLMAKLLTLLNVAGMFKGELPDLEKVGFPYKTARANAVFKNGVLHISEGEINSSAMRIFFQGKEDLTAKTHELSVVVAPLKTVDLLVSHIPLVRDVLDKGVVIYPIKVSGPWENPKLKLLAPDAVGVEIWGIVTRALKLPLKILEPLFPGDRNKEDTMPDIMPHVAPMAPTSEITEN